MNHVGTSRTGSACRNTSHLRTAPPRRLQPDFAAATTRSYRDFLLRLHLDSPHLRPGSRNAYLFATALVAAATMLRLALSHILPSAPFILLFPALVATTLICGLRAGVFSLALASMSAWFFILPSTYSFWLDNIQQVYTLIAFALVGCLIVAMAGGTRLMLEYASQLNRTLTTVFDFNPDAILLTDRPGRITRANRRAAELFGASATGLSGAPLASLLPERFRDRHAAYHAAYMAAPHPRGMGAGLNLCGLRHDGVEFPVDIQFAPVEIDGEMQSIVTVRDLTEYKRLNDALADSRAQHAVLAERQRGAEEMRLWADAFKHAAIGMVVSRPGTALPLAVNPAYADMHDVTPDDIKDLSSLAHVLPEDHAAIAAVIAEADRTGHASCEARHIRRDGSVFPVETEVASIRGADGNVVYRVKSTRDVSRRHAIERERQQQRLELERSNRDLESFAYIASHDLKAPLRAITHLTEWINDDVAKTAKPETLDHLTLLASRVARLQKLLDGLLAYSRIGHHRSNIEELDVAELVHDITAVAPPPPGFEIVCAGDMPRIRTSSTPLRVVLDNLIGNSLKHHDRAEGRITIAMRMTDGVAEFRVADDGPGIAPQFHERIFQIFQTLASRDVVESSGMGLAIVKRLVETHGGQVWIESTPPQRGSAFVFTWKEGSTED